MQTDTIHLPEVSAADLVIQPLERADTIPSRWYWDPAFHLEGDALLDCEQRPGLYLIGDHNVCDLEDTFITGVYAALRILADTPRKARTRSGASNLSPSCSIIFGSRRHFDRTLTTSSR